MQCKHPLVKKLRKAGASTKSAVKIVKALQKDIKRLTANYGDDISYMFIFSDQPEGYDYWRKINQRMGY